MRQESMTHDELVKRVFYIQGIRNELGKNHGIPSKEIPLLAEALLKVDWEDLRNTINSPAGITKLQDHRQDMLEFTKQPPSFLRLATEEMFSYTAPYFLSGYDFYLKGNISSFALYVDAGWGAALVYGALRMAEAATKGTYDETIIGLEKFVAKYNMQRFQPRSLNSDEEKEKYLLKDLLEKNLTGKLVIRERVSSLWTAQRTPSQLHIFKDAVPKIVVAGASIAEKAYHEIWKNAQALPPLESKEV